MILTIEPKGEKGRAFSADLLAHATADALWTDADTKNTRPVWAVFAGPSEQLRAFMENLRLGHPARTSSDRNADRFEFLRSAPYRWWTRSLPAGGSVLTVAHPSLLSWRVPAEETYRYRFLVIPALAWLAAQSFDLDRARALLDRLIASSVADEVAVTYADRNYDYATGRVRVSYKTEINVTPERSGEPLHDLLGYGALLLSYLDHRLPLPVPRDPVFGAWLLLVSQYGKGPVVLSSRADGDTRRWLGYTVEDPNAAGCAPGFLFTPRRFGFHHSGPDGELKAISEWLAREVRRWFAVGGA